jgi:pilus assembly protein CpaF
VIRPCSLRGVTLTICKFNVRQFETTDPIQAGMLNATPKRIEEYVMARKNILISGVTGAGKTTLLSILAGFVPEDERIVLIEDRPRGSISQKNVLRFEVKRAVRTRELSQILTRK